MILAEVSFLKEQAASRLEVKRDGVFAQRGRSGAVAGNLAFPGTLPGSVRAVTPSPYSA